MSFSYLICTSSEGSPLVLKTPLTGEKRPYDVDSCCEYLIDYYDCSQTAQTIQNDTSHIEHWWDRKWQVCLDYYLFTPAQEEASITSSDFSVVSEKIDVMLPNQKVGSQLSPLEALVNRKTYRKFQEKPLSLDITSILLSELNNELFHGIWKYYVVAFNVEDIAPGIYCFHPDQHGLSLIKGGMFRQKVVELLCGMSASLTASFLIILSIDIQKAMGKFSYNRALREMYIDSGRLAQKLLLKGMQYHVGGLPSPAMRDSKMCEFLNIESDEFIPIYTLAMGIIPGKNLNTDGN